MYNHLQNIYSAKQTAFVQLHVLLYTMKSVLHSESFWTGTNKRIQTQLRNITVQHGCKGHDCYVQEIEKLGVPYHSFLTPQPIELKLCMSDYVTVTAQTFHFFKCFFFVISLPRIQTRVFRASPQFFHQPMQIVGHCITRGVPTKYLTPPQTPLLGSFQCKTYYTQSAL